MTFADAIVEAKAGRRIINTVDRTVFKYEKGQLLQMEVNSNGKESYRLCRNLNVGGEWEVEGINASDKLDEFLEHFTELNRMKVFNNLEGTVIREALINAHRRLQHGEQ